MPDMDDGNPLGEYLRARREQVRPEDVGLTVRGLRRVPGLRREEVAMLAGVSADYYLRLEQGRDRNPSAQVLAALADALRLDAPATDHLMSLAAQRAHRAPTRRTGPDRVPSGVAMLLESLGIPAFVETRTFDVLAANRHASALAPGFRPGRNRLLDVFLDPAERELWCDWDRAVARLVAGFRASVGAATDDPRCVEVVGELSLRSPLFRSLWARHDVRPVEGAPTELVHPEVGPMTLLREKLALTGTDGQVLVLYHAEPGSTSEAALALLGSLAATTAPATTTTAAAAGPAAAEDLTRP